MSQKTGREAIQEAVNLLLAEEHGAAESACRYRYARAALLAFDEIRMLLGRGVSFVRICKSFEATGVLPENARAHGFRQAFHRECRRRGEKYTRGKRDKKETSPPVIAGRAAENTEKTVKSEAVPPTAEALEMERRKKLGLGRPIHTGNGTIVKNTDGSFDYD